MNKEDIIKCLLKMKDISKNARLLSFNVENDHKVGNLVDRKGIYTKWIDIICLDIDSLMKDITDVESFLRQSLSDDIKRYVGLIDIGSIMLFPEYMKNFMPDSNYVKYALFCNKLADIYSWIPFENGINSYSVAMLDSNLIDKVYNECNDRLWMNIRKDEFKEMLISGNIGFQIKNGNRQRVMALLNRISFTITDEKAKSAWIENVEETLEVKSLSKIYELDDMNSEPNKKFNRFLNGIYSK